VAISGGLLGTLSQRPEAGGFTGRLSRIRPDDPGIDPQGIVLPPDVGTMREVEQDASPQWNEDMLRIMRLMRSMGAI
jgi:hypothetical protein